MRGTNTVMSKSVGEDAPQKEQKSIEARLILCMHVELAVVLKRKNLEPTKEFAGKSPMAFSAKMVKMYVASEGCSLCSFCFN